MLLGLSSLFLVHAIARRLVGALDAWALVVAVLALSSFGIYLGRVQRWNSWDVVVHPQSLALQIGGGLLHPLNHPRPLGLTVLLTSFLLVSYLVLYSFARLSPEWPDASGPLLAERSAGAVAPPGRSMRHFRDFPENAER